MDKTISLEVTCKRNRFGYWNLCKRLPNFVNVAALVSVKKCVHRRVQGFPPGTYQINLWGEFAM